MVDFAEKIDKFRENEVPLDLILSYYIDFVWYFGSQLYPVFLFLAVIFFTSRMSDNNEIIALHKPFKKAPKSNPKKDI